MCVRRADRVVTPGGEAPGADARGVEVRLAGYPGEDGGPETVWGGGVGARGGAVGDAGDVEDDCCPAAGEELV